LKMPPMMAQPFNDTANEARMTGATERARMMDIDISPGAKPWTALL
jgi:hypothetical protein